MVAESAWGGGFWYGFGRVRTAKMGKAQIGEYQQSPPTLRKRANSLISGAFSLFSHTFPILFLHGSRMALVLGHGFEAGMVDLVTDRGRLGYGLLLAVWQRYSAGWMGHRRGRGGFLRQVGV